MMTTWRSQLELAMKEYGDPGPVVAYAPDEPTFDVEFDDRFGLSEGPPVLAWTGENVYFPVVYDGAEWLDAAPRNPRAKGQDHVGGQ